MMDNNYLNEIGRQWKLWRDVTIPETTARETAYRVIRDKIIGLNLKPGEPLRDKDLAEELEMGRTPVREALIMLTNSSLVVFKPQSGTFVAPIDVQRMELEQFSRFAMEKEVISRACGKIAPAMAERYRQNLDTYRQLEQGEGQMRTHLMLGVDNDFHSIAFEAAGMKRNFYHMIDSLQHMERMRLLSIMCMDQNILLQEHQEISKALIEGNPVAAQYWLHVHLHRYIENMKTVRERFPEYFELG